MSAGDEDQNPNELVIEVDGEGVHLDTLNASAVLEFTVAYLNLLRLCAEERDEPLEFRGLRAFEKCGSLGTFPNDAETARQSTLDAHKLLTSRERPSFGLKGAVEWVREKREAMPSHYTVVVKVCGLERRVSAQPSSTIADTPYATTSLRAYVQRVGGAKPRATFRSKSEARVFHLDLKDAEQGTALAKHLYKTVDISALVLRDEDGHIEGGMLREFQPVLDADPVRAWNEWFKEAGVTSPEQLEENRRKGRGRGDG